MTNLKPSELFEGENSGLRKAFDEAVARGEHKCEEDLYGNCYTCGKNMLESQNKWEEKEWLENLMYLVGDKSTVIWTAILTLIEQKNRHLLKAEREESKKELEDIKEQVEHCIIVCSEATTKHNLQSNVIGTINAYLLDKE